MYVFSQMHDAVFLKALAPIQILHNLHLDMNEIHIITLYPSCSNQSVFSLTCRKRVILPQEKIYPNWLCEVGILFHSRHTNGAVSCGRGSLDRTYGGHFTHTSLESDMKKYANVQFFSVLLRFCVFVGVVTLPAYRSVSNGTRLGMDGYLLWLLAFAQSCCSFWECFPCCSLVCYSDLIES